ncbi:17542_t:CDS:1, partial [Entrophospora sp. SA101]
NESTSIRIIHASPREEHDYSDRGGMTLSGENFQRPTWIDKS